MKQLSSIWVAAYLKNILLIAFMAGSVSVCAQQSKIDSLNRLIQQTKTDTAKIDLYRNLGQTYRNAQKVDSAIFCYQQSLKINRANNYSLQIQSWDMGAMDYLLYEMGNYTASLQIAFEDLRLTQKINDTYHLGFAYAILGHNYRELGEYRLALDYLFKAKQAFIRHYTLQKEHIDVTFILQSIGEVYLKMNMPDSALMYTKHAYNEAIKDSVGVLVLLAERILGDIYLAKDNTKTALCYYRQYIPDYIKYNETNRDICFVLNNMAAIFQKNHQNDSAIFYAKKALNKANEIHDQKNIYTASNMLSDIYAQKDNSKNSDLYAQPKLEYNKIGRLKIDSLKKELKFAQGDSLKFRVLEALAQEYVNVADLNSAIQVEQQRWELAEKSALPTQWKVWALASLEYLTFITSDYSLCLKYAMQCLPLSEEIHDNNAIAGVYTNIAAAYAGMKDYRKAIEYYFKSKKFWEINGSPIWAIQSIAETYLKMHMTDSALYYNKIAYHMADTAHNPQYMKDFAIRVYGAIYQEKGEDALALKYYHQFINDFYHYNLNNREADRVYLGISQIYLKDDRKDSAIFYAKKGLAAAQAFNDQEHIYIISDFLSKLNDTLNNAYQALAYFKIAQAAKDSMEGIEKIRQIQQLTFAEETREKEQAEADAKDAARRTRTIVIASIIIAIAASLIWFRIRQLRLKYQTILEQKESAKIKAEYNLNKSQMERQILELEARALRAQMNPHFIFNCLNSIKSLIQQQDEDKAIMYLTTFSKLIRTIFNNSDKREISLFDEIETCKLYTQLESMRFESRFSYSFSIDDEVDMKSISVPALIIQPFIENSIWHGIMPKEEGGHLEITIKDESESVCCIIDDDGIGREMSKQNKFRTGSTHNSKGMHLTQSRIDLDNLINNRHASLQVIDKKDEAGNAAGTKVILVFKKY